MEIGRLRRESDGMWRVLSHDKRREPNFTFFVRVFPYFFRARRKRFGMRENCER
jgi:hypothetical protein